MQRQSPCYYTAAATNCCRNMTALDLYEQHKAPDIEMAGGKPPLFHLPGVEEEDEPWDSVSPLAGHQA